MLSDLTFTAESDFFGRKELQVRYFSVSNIVSIVRICVLSRLAEKNMLPCLLFLTCTHTPSFCLNTQELVPGGSKINVTEGNKRQYVDLIARHHMTTSIKQQINAVLEGFWELVPRCVCFSLVFLCVLPNACCLCACVSVCVCVHKCVSPHYHLCQANAYVHARSHTHAHKQHTQTHRHLISIFNDHELELLISGLPDIDVADLRANTEYQGYNPNTPVVR